MSRALCVFVSKQTLERVGSFLLPFSLCSVGWIQINQRKWQKDKIKHRKHLTHAWFLTPLYISSNAFSIAIFGLQVIKLECWDSKGLFYSVMQVSQVGWVFGKAVWRQKQIVKPTHTTPRMRFAVMQVSWVGCEDQLEKQIQGCW